MNTKQRLKYEDTWLVEIAPRGTQPHDSLWRTISGYGSPNSADHEVRTQRRHWRKKGQTMRVRFQAGGEL